MNRNENNLKISGEIEAPQPSLNNKNLVLITNSESDSQTELDCSVTEIKSKNYTLNCNILKIPKSIYKMLFLLLMIIIY